MQRERASRAKPIWSGFRDVGSLFAVRPSFLEVCGGPIGGDGTARGRKSSFFSVSAFRSLIFR